MGVVCRVFSRTLGSFIRLLTSGICFASDIAFGSLQRNKKGLYITFDFFQHHAVRM